MTLWKSRAVIGLLAVGGPAISAPVDTATARDAPFVYEIESWGHVVYHLELHPDGKAVSWRQRIHTTDRYEEQVEQRSPETYPKVIKALRPFERKVKMDCRNGPSDGPTSLYHWSRGPKRFDFGFYRGCTSATVRRVDEVLWPLLWPAP